MRDADSADRALLVRRAAARADVVRSIMPLAATLDAVQCVIERKLITGDDLPRGATSQLQAGTQ